MPTVVGVKLRFPGKILWFDPAGTSPEAGAFVVVSTERGHEFGEVASAPQELDPSEIEHDLKPVLRIATDADIAEAERLRDEESKAMSAYRRLVKQHRLDMKPIDVEFLFDGSKIVFYFVAEERVDFRDLVKDLASEFHARIDMRQVGVRDEARMVGGLGHCGEQLCCTRFGGEFQPVSIRMAKEQDLPLNPLKISGLCGRLMCCLRYEYEAYKDYKGRAPKRGTIVETPNGLGKVVDLDTPRELVTMRLEQGGTLQVPLAAMDCHKGGECPCRVRREALEEIGHPEFQVPEIEPEPPLTMEKPAPGEAQPQREGRRRRRKPSGGGEQKGEQKAGEQKAGEQQPKQPKQPKQQPGGGQGEPRRRRRDRGGERPAAQQQPAQQQPSQQPKPASGDGEKPASPARRRRRRRPGGGGGPKEA